MAYMASQTTRTHPMLFVPAPPPAGAPAPEGSGLLTTFRRLWPYLWPQGRADLQRRVFLAFGLLLVAKLVTVLTPFTYKWATDALVRRSGVRQAGPSRPARPPRRALALGGADPAHRPLRGLRGSPWRS